MMTGIQNVNSLEAGYYAATLIFIGWFALYDFRRHLVRNQALAIFFFWCLLSLPLTASTVTLSWRLSWDCSLEPVESV